MRNSVLVMVTKDGCGGTAPFFYPAGQGNTSVDIDGLVVKGGGFLLFYASDPARLRDLGRLQADRDQGRPVNPISRILAEEGTTG